MPLQHFLLVIPHGGSRSGGGEANEFLHSLNLPKFRYVVESSLEDGWNSEPYHQNQNPDEGRYCTLQS